MAKHRLPGRSANTWGQIAAELLAFENDEKKAIKFGTMASFIRAQSVSTGRSVTTLWRLLGAGRFYEEVRQRVTLQDREIPLLANPECKASVESLELLQRISRVLPKAEWEALEMRVVLGEIPRRELKVIWETYRPVLGGMTKRGRGKQAPRYDSRSAAMRGALVESNAIASLVSAGPSWLKLPNPPYFFKSMPFAGKPHLRRDQSTEIDLVVLVKTTEGSPTLLHGVRALDKLRPDRAKSLGSPDTAPVDLLWIALPNPPEQKLMKIIDNRIGIVCTKRKSISIVRFAKTLELTEANAVFRERLLRSLLIDFAKAQ